MHSARRPPSELCGIMLRFFRNVRTCPLPKGVRRGAAVFEGVVESRRLAPMFLCLVPDLRTIHEKDES